MGKKVDVPRRTRNIGWRNSLYKICIPNQCYRNVVSFYHFNTYTKLEPWGSGFYINSIGLEVVDEYTKTKIILNLGDEIRCVSETIETGYS